jgi:hypothetical protein
MDIHKPKPWHGLREFLKEYAIIVVGVLTALAGEQAVEAAHNHAQVAELRKALDTELAWNMATMKQSADDVDCVGRRLDELDRWKGSLRSSRPLPLKGDIPAPNYAIFRTSVWRSASAGTLDHMPLDARLDYARFYDGIENNMRIRDQAKALWQDVVDFQDARDLTGAEFRQVSHDIRQLRRNYRSIALNYDVWKTLYAPRLRLHEQGPSRDVLPGRVEEMRAGVCNSLLGG